MVLNTITPYPIQLITSIININCIPFYRYSGAFWIGVFSDDTTTDVYNVKKQPFNFTNWDETSFGPENIGENGTFVFNSTVCVKGDLSSNFSWRLTDCDDKLPYVCEVTGMQ